MKKFFKILLGLFVSFLVLIVAAVIVLKVMYPPERIRAIVEPQLSRMLNRDVTVKSASLSLYPSVGVTLEGLSLSNTSRTLKIDKLTTLWTYLQKANLKKKYVRATVNGKEVQDIEAKDASLKPGDTLRVWREGFRNKEMMFSLGKLFVDVKVAPLFRKNVVIQKLLLDKLEILVEVNRRGSFNFDDLMAPTPAKGKTPKKASPKKGAKKSALPISFRLNSFVIKDSKIVYYNRKERQEIILGDIQQDLAIQFDPEMKDVVTKGLFEIKRMTVRGKGLPVRKSGMYFMLRHKLHVNVKEGNLRIDELSFGFQKTVVTTRGLVRGFDKPIRYLDLKINTNKLRLQDLYREVPPALFPQARKMKVKGTAQLALNVKGKQGGKKPAAMPAVNGLFRIDGGYIQYADLPQAINQLNTNIVFTPNSLDVKKLAFRLGQNPVSLLLKVRNFKKPIVDALLKADVNLATLKDVVKLPKGVSAQGAIKANVSAKGQIDPKNPEAIAVKGKIALAKIVANTPAVKKPVQVDGTFQFTNDEVSLDELVTTIGSSSITMNMKIRNYLSLALPKKTRQKTTVATYSMTSPLINVDEILGPQKSTKGKGSKKTVARKSTASSGGPDTSDRPIAIPKLPDVVFNGKIRVKKLIYAEMPIRNAAIDLTYKKGVVNFGMSAKLYSGTIQEKLTLNLSNPKQLKLRNRFSCRRMEANDFLSNLNDIPKDDGKLLSQLKNLDNTIYGRLNLESDVTTHGITPRQLKNNLNGTITSQVRRGRVKNATFLNKIKTALPAIIQKFVPNLSDFRLRRLMLLNLGVNKGRLQVKKMALPLRKLALEGYGSIGLDNSLDLKMDVVLSRYISRQILRQQRRLKKSAGSLLTKVGGGKIGGMIKGKLGAALSRLKVIPTNKQGRVAPIVGIKGTLAKPQYYLAGFQGGPSVDDGGKDDGNLGAQAKKMLKDELNKAKARAQRALRAAKAKAMKAAKEVKAKAMKAAKEVKAKAMKAGKEAQAKAEKAAKEAKAKAEKAVKEAKAKAQGKAKELQRQAEKKKEELQKKAKESAKKGLGSFLK